MWTLFVKHVELMLNLNWLIIHYDQHNRFSGLFFMGSWWWWMNTTVVILVILHKNVRFKWHFQFQTCRALNPSPLLLIYFDRGNKKPLQQGDFLLHLLFKYFYTLPNEVFILFDHAKPFILINRLPFQYASIVKLKQGLWWSLNDLT